MGGNIHPNTTTKLSFNIVIVDGVIKIENDLVFFSFTQDVCDTVKFISGFIVIVI
jgi:hypothetical protein